MPSTISPAAAGCVSARMSTAIAIRMIPSVVLRRSTIGHAAATALTIRETSLRTADPTDRGGWRSRAANPSYNPAFMRLALVLALFLAGCASGGADLTNAVDELMRDYD